MSQSAIDQTTNDDCQKSRIQTENIATMANDLFSEMLEMPFDSTPREPFKPAPNSIQASIQIAGDWKAEFHVIAPYELASQIACAMFGLNGEEISKSDIIDAMGEIVNVIGGNAKGIADGDCQLSLPCVDDYQELQDSPTLVTTFECKSHPISIQLVEKD